MERITPTPLPFLSPCAIEHRCNADEIKDEIISLLKNPPPDATDKELLTIVISNEKAHFYEFLRDYTRFEAKGKWTEETKRGLKVWPENNKVYQILFKDTRSELVGETLIKLIENYNEEAVKESVACAFTSPIEESTL